MDDIDAICARIRRWAVFEGSQGCRGRVGNLKDFRDSVGHNQELRNVRRKQLNQEQEGLRQSKQVEVAVRGRSLQGLIVCLAFCLHLLATPVACWRVFGDGEGKGLDLDGRRSHVHDWYRANFDPVVANYLLNHSRSTYCDIDLIANWTCEVCQDESLKAFKPYFVNAETWKHVGVYVGYDSRRDMIVTAFRGTLFLINWIQDLEYLKVDSDYPECEKASREYKAEKTKHKCMVHSGFYEDWLSVQKHVVNATLRALADNPSASVWVTGHSLGGAMAAFGALDLALTLNRTDVGMYTFGEPRVGNLHFASFWGTWVPNGIRLVHQDDAVPHLPPRGRSVWLLTDFHHTITEVWQTGPNDDTYQICGETGEDPHCSDSLAKWDRSVEAHLWYMGQNMKCMR